MDYEARFAAVRAKREPQGLNVRFLRADGTPDCFSFPTLARAEAFKASIVRQGLTLC